ncbi:MAG: hypothetical protein ABR974_10970 [Bacteroidales bacterium]
MKDRIRTIADKIIEESFPLLKGKKIFYLSFYLRFFGFSAWIPPFTRIIVISTRTKKLDDFALTGIIAHELCHQERYRLMGFFRYLWFVLSYTFSEKARSSEERATDKLTIEKGYGRQLYELTLISQQDKNHLKIIDNYLTPDEIRSYAESLGKWQTIG